MLDFHDDYLILTTKGSEEQPSEFDDGGCFEPFIPRVQDPPALKPAPEPTPRSFMPIIEGALRDHGCGPTPTDTSETESQVPVADGNGGQAETSQEQPCEIPALPVEAPPPPPRLATAAELFTWVKRTLVAQTNLQDDAAELVSFWLISTWFQDALTILPCLVITGHAHDGAQVLHVLGNFCQGSVQLAGFRQSHLDVLRCYKTHLVSEPNLDKRTANLLSNLTDMKCLVVAGSSIGCYSKSAAIYAGENPETHKIQNSIHIHIAPTSAVSIKSPQWLEKMIERVPVHFEQYRNRYLRKVRRSMWAPSGLSSEMATIAMAFGRCIMDAELRQKLVALLKAQDKLRLSEMSTTIEAIVLEATRTLSQDGRDHAYAREIAAQCNRLLETRGERARVSPEKAGRQLMRLGLRTRPLSQAGNGLTFDNATIARIQQLAAMYIMEDTPAEIGNLLDSQLIDKNQID